MPAQKLDFARIKAHASFEPVLRHYGLPIPQPGKKIPCCFHNETTPSLSVSFVKKCFKCFGCRKEGDLIAFVMAREDCDHRTAARKLAEICGIALEGGSKPPRTTKAEPKEESAEEKPLRPLGFRLEPEWHPRLVARGVDKVAPLFGVGFVKPVSPEKPGLMANRIVFPLYRPEAEKDENPVAYIGRIVGEGEPRWLLPKDFPKSRVLFGLQHAKASKGLCVVESPWSVLRLCALRIPAVATLGSSISIEQVRLLKEHTQAKHIFLMFDPDEAGIAGAESAAPLIAKHFWCKIITLSTQPSDASEEEIRTAIAS